MRKSLLAAAFVVGGAISAPALTCSAADTSPGASAAAGIGQGPTAQSSMAQNPVAQSPTAPIPTAQSPMAQIPVAQNPTAQNPPGNPAPEDMIGELAEDMPEHPGWGRPGMPGGDRDGEMRQGGGRPEGWGHHGWMHHWMARMMGREMTPQQRCDERIARRAGLTAYVVAKLQLTAQQQPLWDKVRGTLEQAGGKMHQLCATLKPMDQRGAETILDRMNRRQQFLSARLETLQATQPEVQQLYQALSPEQRAIMDHPFRRM